MVHAFVIVKFTSVVRNHSVVEGLNRHLPKHYFRVLKYRYSEHLTAIEVTLVWTIHISIIGCVDLALAALPLLKRLAQKDFTCSAQIPVPSQGISG